ncbi:wax ester/triacylglycerol synthase domain-containing protein [Mycolicibacterium sp. CBMA 226]|uniref:wax ester/triacylglycerol synthase domain-containing protein n=1 Tax=Mycolicibacterium sp. CBMA 226 TaxID=2606611 RepID=UPI001AA0F1A9|nr:wax ester/triacylglycerol synthase domain-containing protein [Mycolicibacterium sp. CBMA 226]
MTGADNTIDLGDQASFTGLRALGRGPLIQYTWIYDHPVDLDGLRRLHRNLGSGGLLGRRIERSPLPFGRHRWVRSSGPLDLDIAPGTRPVAELNDWINERAHVPVDPEHGPPWHLGVQQLEGGGAAVSLVVSHTVGDGLAVAEAVADAVNGTPRDLGYPPPGARTRSEALREDLRQTARSVPTWFKAVVGAVKIARDQKGDLAASAKSVTAPVSSGITTPVTPPFVTVHVEIEEWHQRAKALNGTGNVMFAALAAQVGQVVGRLGDDGRAMLSFPVNIRNDGDTRGNALSTITVMADPEKVSTDLSELRGDIKRELAGVDEWTKMMLTPLPLTPLVPKFAVRRLEKMVLKVGKPIGCSNLGVFPAAFNRLDGTEADNFHGRLVEPGLTPVDLERLNGHLFLVWCQTPTSIIVTVTAWEPGESNTKAALADSTRKALDELGLTGTVD